ncbi:MAG TPA: UPF0175 family protein [Pirellulales bacterium]|nr:UPF0175 family protein [Pirellulales bacterium]
MRQSLEKQLGGDLTQAAKEAMAIAWYQAEKLSIGQVAELLGIAVYEADGLMKERHIEAAYSLEDYERDRETLEREMLSRKRQKNEKQKRSSLGAMVAADGVLYLPQSSTRKTRVLSLAAMAVDACSIASIP